MLVHDLLHAPPDEEGGGVDGAQDGSPRADVAEAQDLVRLGVVHVRDQVLREGGKQRVAGVARGRGRGGTSGGVFCTFALPLRCLPHTFVDALDIRTPPLQQGEGQIGRLVCLQGQYFDAPRSSGIVQS